MPTRRRIPADRVARTRLLETLHFPDLTERRTLGLAAVPRYAARSHFGPWRRLLGTPDWSGLQGLFTPLVHVDLTVEDVPCDLDDRIEVRGESSMARTLDGDGQTRHLVRDGRHTLRRADGSVVARARMVNVLTRYDRDPARRRVTELPAELGLGTVPSRVVELPELDDLAPAHRAPDVEEPLTHTWHLGQTDPNRHVNGVAYLRVVEDFVAGLLHARGHDLRTLRAARARIVYRKPCFRGDDYRRVAWLRGDAPLVVTGAVVPADSPPDARPAVAVELTLLPH